MKDAGKPLGLPRISWLPGGGTEDIFPLTPPLYTPLAAFSPSESRKADQSGRSPQARGRSAGREVGIGARSLLRRGVLEEVALALVGLLPEVLACDLDLVLELLQLFLVLRDLLVLVHASVDTQPLAQTQLAPAPSDLASCLTLAAVQAWINGCVVDETVSGISVFDHGLTVGDAVFETIALRNGVALAVTRHLGRLARSAAGLGLPEPDPDELRDGIDSVVAANPGIVWGAIRVTHTSGPGTVGSGRGHGRPTSVVAARELEPPAPVCDVITAPWPRNERGALAGLKTTSYAENVMALAEARRRGAGEAIFANTLGELCEGSGTNIFVVLAGRLITPPLTAGCLAGITRALIVERCGVDVEERTLPVSALAEADEAFLTSAIRDVQPIGAVDGRRLPMAPGPLTGRTAEAYAALLATEPNP